MSLFQWSYASEPPAEWMRQVQFANALVDRGELLQAKAIYRTASKEAQNAGDDLRAGAVLQNLGRLLEREGRMLEAEKAYARAVDALTRAGRDDRLLVRATAGLSAIYIQNGQYSKAEAMVRRALAENRAGAPPDKATLFGNLGVILIQKHQFEEAEQVLRNTARMCLNAADTETNEVGAIAVANLAGLQVLIGHGDDAIASYRQAITMMEMIPNAAPATLAGTLCDFALIQARVGDRATAARLYEKAIAVAEARLGPIHPVLGKSLERYAELLRETGNRSEARRLSTMARRIQDESTRENLTGHTVDAGALLPRR